MAMSNQIDLTTLTAEAKCKVDRYLLACLKSDNRFDSAIFEAMRYSVGAGGKRLRAIMLLQANRNGGGAEEDALPFAAAIEFIHTYSLIHDDLPAMDDDNLRRGKPTNHVVFGEAMAILAGDGLLNLAFQKMIAQVIAMADKTAGLNALHTIATAAGVDGMLGGQAMDVAAEGEVIAEDVLHYIHTHKTAALIEASLVAGAQLASCPQRVVDHYRTFGHHLGMAFQIVDDILDIEGDCAQLGKATGVDSVHQKATFPALYGLAESRRRAQKHTELAMATLDQIAERGSYLHVLSRLLLCRDY